MRKILTRLGLALGLSAVLLGIAGVGAAQAATPDSDISQTTVHSTAYRVGNGASLRFYGVLQAKPNTNGTPTCYRMQYRQPEGNWVNEGFWIAENIQVTPLEHCSNELSDYQTWSIHAGLDVRGIRFVKVVGGTNVGTHCNIVNGVTDCRDMYQGT